LLIIAISGGAIISPLYGRIADANKQELIEKESKRQMIWQQLLLIIIVFLIPCYVIILLFAVWGHKIKNWSK
jgi:fucose permease